MSSIEKIEIGNSTHSIENGHFGTLAPASNSLMVKHDPNNQCTPSSSNNYATLLDKTGEHHAVLTYANEVHSLGDTVKYNADDGYINLGTYGSSTKKSINCFSTDINYSQEIVTVDTTSPGRVAPLIAAAYPRRGGRILGGGENDLAVTEADCAPYTWYTTVVAVNSNSTTPGSPVNVSLSSRSYANGTITYGSSLTKSNGQDKASTSPAMYVPGFVPVAVCGYDSNSRLVLLTRAFLSNHSESGATLTWMITNQHPSSSVSCHVEIAILWRSLRQI